MNTCLEDYITLWVKTSQGKSPPYHVGGYWLCASGDICQVTSQNHAIEGLYNFMSCNYSLYLFTLPSLVAKDIVIVAMYF